ncbi:MAG: hypothetical protein COV44_02275 [Deltaproteobacteria bacterium CG11_big_fil_rev_8_21_14_0_20_45_16]|nr:MAG: hypothetical protein COV44_02275 [Deltaproteobacteria bacterium CG11_big_fil_rev_8_21_14_0_20_45_16]
MIFPPFRGFVRTFVLICVGVFILEQIALFGPFGDGSLYRQMIRMLGLEPQLALRGLVYQLVTWVFLHGNLMHLVFNMFAFWMFGSLLQDTFGQKRFIKFTFLAAIFSALVIILFSLFDEMSFNTPTIGASGIVFSILIAVSCLFPNQVVLFFFVFPMKMKYFAYLMVAFEFYALYSSNNQGISNIAHLGGALFGWLYVAWFNRSGRGGGRSNWFKTLMDQLHQRRRRKHLRIIYPESKTRYHFEVGAL